MSHRIVALFAGQGAQKIGMAQDWVTSFPSARALLDRANAVLAESLPDFERVLFEGPEETLTRTSYCQPALYVHGLIGLELLKAQVPGLEVEASAGLSLGEFTAHAAAGTFDFETGLKLVARRGLFMEEACNATEGTMAAMIGGEEAAVKQLASDVDVDVANYNSPGQIVLSGTKEGIQKAIAEAKGRGIRIAKELPVAGAYHSRLMISAQEKLAQELAGLDLKQPTIPVISNVLAQVVSAPDAIRQALIDQVTGSVRWTESIELLLNEGKTRFVEFGPKGVLAGLLGRIRKGSEVLVVEDNATLEVAVQKLKEA